ERDQPAWRLRHRRGAARRARERRHLAENFSRLDRAQFLPARGEADAALEQEVHLVAAKERTAHAPVLAEDRPARRDRFHLAAGFEEIERGGWFVARNIHRLIGRHSSRGCGPGPRAYVMPRVPYR